MTRGEAPGGSRPGVFDAIRPAGGWMGIATALLAGALTPIRTASPAARNRSRWQPPAPFMGLAGGCPRARDGENSASLIFLALPRSASALLGRAFLTLSPPYGWG